MKSPKILALGALFVTFVGGVRASPVKLPQVDEFESTVKVKSQIIFKTEAGNHFNATSPLSCGEGAKMVDKAANLVKCSYPKEGSYRPFLAVCDDGLKFCKIYRPEITVGKSGPGPKGAMVTIKKKTSVEHGFKMGTAEVFLEANHVAKKPKAVLIDFFALWCPPCNDLDELVFSTPLFQKEAKSLEKIKINVDEPESWSLKEKFKILGFPTLVYLNPQGEEVGRYWGTQSPELMVEWLHKMKRLENQPMSWAMQQSDAENVQRVVEWNFDRSNFNEVKTLTGARTEDWAHKYFARAEAALAGEAKDYKKQIEKIEFLLKFFPNDVNYGYFLQDLVGVEGVDKKAAEKYLPQALANLDSWRQRPADLLKENVSEQDLVTLKVDLLEAFDKKDELKKAQQDAIAFLEKALDGGKKISRGRSHILAYYYRETGRVEDAKKIYESLVKYAPQEFTFYYRYANALKSLKQYDEALKWLEKGAPYMTEGNSRLQYAWMKGTLLKELGRKDEALQFVEGTLEVAKVPDWNKDRANNLIRDLNELKTQLLASAKTP